MMREDRRVVAEKLLTTPHPGRRGFALIRGPLYQIGDSGVWQVGLATVEVPAEATIRGEPAVGAQKTGAVGIDADVAQNGQILRHGLLRGECITRIRDGRAAEIQRVAMYVEYRFDDIGVAHGGFVMDRMTGRGDGAFRVVMQMPGYGADKLRRHQRLVALHIDHNGVVRPSALLDDFGDAVRAAGVGVLGQAGLEAVLVHDIGDGVMIGGDPDLLRAALCRLFGNPHHHRLSGNRQKRLAGQPGGSVARRNDDVESEH